jgi:Zn finger protein HypA/HybF involved in hydrogenase expression
MIAGLTLVMHEQSIVESLLALAIASAEKEKASKILRIYVVVGELSKVV